MARTEGTLKLSSNIEPRAAAPLDARTVVPTLADLTASGAFPYPYIGMIVSVQSEGKAYMLTALDTTDSGNWTEVGTGASSKIFTGTTLEWESVVDKSTYDMVNITDDYNGANITDEVTQNDLRVVTSNAVYTAISNYPYNLIINSQTEFEDWIEGDNYYENVLLNTNIVYHPSTTIVFDNLCTNLVGSSTNIELQIIFDSSSWTVLDSSYGNIRNSGIGCSTSNNFFMKNLTLTLKMDYLTFSAPANNFVYLGYNLNFEECIVNITATTFTFTPNVVRTSFTTLLTSSSTTHNTLKNTEVNIYNLPKFDLNIVPLIYRYDINNCNIMCYGVICYSSSRNPQGNFCVGSSKINDTKIKYYLYDYQNPTFNASINTLIYNYLRTKTTSTTQYFGGCQSCVSSNVSVTAILSLCEGSVTGASNYYFGFRSFANCSNATSCNSLLQVGYNLNRETLTRTTKAALISFAYCNKLESCTANHATAAMEAVSHTDGFYGCSYLQFCNSNIDIVGSTNYAASGYYDCKNLQYCGGAIYNSLVTTPLCHSCNNISYFNISNSYQGFYNCNYIDHSGGKDSAPNIGWTFDGCTALQYCYSDPDAGYTEMGNNYASPDTSVRAANTAAGGWNYGFS